MINRVTVRLLKIRIENSSSTIFNSLEPQFFLSLFNVSLDLLALELNNYKRITEFMDYVVYLGS